MQPKLVTKNIFEKIPNMAVFYLNNTFFYDPKILSWRTSIMWNKCS